MTNTSELLPPAIARLKQAYPQVSVHLQPTGDEEVLATLARGEADDSQRLRLVALAVADECPHSTVCGVINFAVL